MRLRVMRMATLPIHYYRKQALGLTLIEVLIALAIVSIAMTAIIKAVSQNIRSTDYLQNKTIAMYVARQALTERQLGLKSNEQSIMLDRKWYCHINEMETPNKRIKKIIVQVFAGESNQDELPIVSLDGYVYDAK
jgi:general secretion pathway protein I